MRLQASTLLKLAIPLVAVATLSGCAVGPDRRDPMETWNRGVFKFNDTVDTYALKPVATGYKNITPTFVQTGVNNFFGNLRDVWTAGNNLLQGKFKDGASDVGRVALNSTLGLLGVIDIASEAGLQKHNEDFGQTLGKWGVQSGPYVMLPLLGPSTLRDTVGLPLDFAADPWTYKDPTHVRNIGVGLRIIDQRAALLDASSLLEDAALDRYEFIRDGYLQRRQSQVYDGDVPEQKGENVPDQPAVNPTGDGEKPAVAPAPDVTPAPAPETTPAPAPAQ
ncbi:phospholipid-binding lipoprotein MlaA [Pseudoduganella lurida]|uniref:Phospholipid-binding lipoprotein MlaA n=1 Tax=Pseudoduganella lurida TaxID=1036180 RepID=A0A562R094_9BURK|nr:MlaA family lipoprotein [Pseudoduganella lurida]TWI61806.1 phospholipid-binding lipoprotein MlaA [Pseudoduganella lurida]